MRRERERVSGTCDSAIGEHAHADRADRREARARLCRPTGGPRPGCRRRCRSPQTPSARRPTCRCSAITFAPNRMTTSCSSEPRNQKYEMPMTVSHEHAIAPQQLRCRSQISPHGFRLIRLRGPATAGGDARDAEARRRCRRPRPPRPAMPTAQSVRVPARRTGSRRPPCPSTIATNVLISSTPFARDRSRSGSISGRMPYFAGLKNVACTRDQEQHGVGELQAARRERHQAERAPRRSRATCSTTSTVRLL